VGLAAILFARAAGAVPPVTPDGEEARRWAEQELSDPVYTEAEPTPLDRIARAVSDFIGSLFDAELSGAWGPALAIVAAIVVVVLIIVAFLIWGRPRAVGRSRAISAELFGEAEQRSASELRRAAASRAANGEWDAAIVLRFRGLARGLAERGIVELPPGATVHAFARRAGRSFPAFAGELEQAAGAFDDVRYLRIPGSPELYRRVAAVDDALTGARPATLAEATA
jgi:hypothetical protein